MAKSNKAESKKRIPLGIPESTLEHLIRFMKILGNEDSLIILLSAKFGMISSKELIKTTGITQRRFYTRIKDLINVDLIEKVEGRYNLTIMGKKILNLIEIINDWLLKKQHFKLVDIIEKNNLVPEEKKDSLIEMIMPEDFNILFDNYSACQNIKIIYDWKKLAKIVYKEINNAKKNILFATKYVNNIEVAEACLKAIDRGIDTYILFEEININNVKKFIPYLFSIKAIKVISETMNKYSKNVRKLPNITFSFIVIDDELSIFELPNPSKDNFILAIIIEEQMITKELKNIFFSMWEKAKEFL